MPGQRKATAIAIAGCVIFAVACHGSSPSPNPATIIKMGVDLPLTGDESAAARPALNGAMFFVSRHPKLDGFTIAIDSRSDTTGVAPDAARGVKNVEAFIADAHVLAMIGPLDSSVARSEIPPANQAHLAMVSPATSSRCLTKEPYLPAALNPTRVAIACEAARLPSPAELRPTGTNNYFRLATTDDLQGPAAADYAYRNLHLLRVAVVSDREAYGQALAASFTSRFLRLGGSVVAHVEFDPTAKTDLTSFLQQVKNDGAQGVYVGGSAANKACVVRAQMAAVFGAGEAAPLLGGDGIAEDPACIRDAKSNPIGIFATVPSIDAGQVDAARPVIAAFKAAYTGAADYGAYTMAAYDATGVIYDALDRAIKANGGKRPTREQVLATLVATTAYKGVTGTFGFDAAGDTTLRVVSIFEPAGPNPATPWRWVQAVDYSAALPY